MTEAKTTKKKEGKVLWQAGQPLKFVEDPTIEDSPPPPDDLAISVSGTIGNALIAYGKAARALLEGKYASAKEVAPLHMRAPCNLFVVCCTDGVLVRYDSVPTEEESKGRFAALEESLTEVAPKLSDFMIHFPADPKTYSPGNNGPQMSFVLTDANGHAEEKARFCPLLYATTKFPEGFQIAPPPARPPCLVSVENEFDFQLGGLVVPSEAPEKAVTSGTERFIAHARIKLPVGWQNIQIYPLLGGEHWDPKYAPIWAEIDILASLVQRNAVDTSLKALDGRGETRKRYAAFLQEFESLLGGLEEPVHQFLKQHPELICPTHDAFWSKLPFGSTVSDFVFREPNDDYQLVEIEAPIRDLFRKDGQQRQELTHAINQTLDWVQFIVDNKEEVEKTLPGISASPRTLVVIGRSASLTEENHRKLVTLQSQHSKLRILTYDDVLANARSTLERILGPLALAGQNVDLYFFKGAT